MGKHLKLISIEYLQEYSNKVKVDWFDVFNKLKAKTQFSLEDFEYYIISSSLYSSKIEGNTLDANSFFRNRGKKTSPKKKEVQEIETLMEAYKFASENKLNRTNFFKTHSILSKTLLLQISETFDKSSSMENCIFSNFIFLASNLEKSNMSLIIDNKDLEALLIFST